MLELGVDLFIIIDIIEFIFILGFFFSEFM